MNAIFCPLDPAIHPEADLLERRSLLWLSKFDLGTGHSARERLIGTNSAEFYARITPRAVVDRVQPAVNWCYWGFAHDDVHGDGASVRGGTSRSVDTASRVLDVLESRDRRTTRGDVYLAALADIASDFAEFATPTQLRRWAHAHRGWLFAVAWEAANREAGVLPSVHDYLVMRLNSCGGEPTTAMIEMASGAEVPSAEMDSAMVVALTESARMVAALDNDHVSAHREARTGQFAQNLPSVIAHEQRCSPAEALVRSTAIRDRLMMVFLRLSERLPAGSSHELREYVRCLGHTIRGNLDWSLRVPRYHSDTETATDLTPPEGTPAWTNTPSDPNPAPLPIPRLSWWWDHLR
ncbi:terpene synthase family protein [Pseudonocardia spinosispora]|uniref:terpene synthase family protein n=1 Tax=Pseudonocardia spinosispora TaxID=103441 RepID=UPI00041CC3E5|nr:terpene synthase family protein [Pseudonocardia spinosispora]